jgi:GrpB-like predicted nucleotidyltransferase (UPF0157 family)
MEAEAAREAVEISIVEHDPRWSERFEAEASRIRSALGDRALLIEHVGSTSVPGLAAKPIIDICLVVANSSEEASYLPDLESAGYELRVREPEWHEHRMFRTPERDVHVHVFTVGSTEIDRHLRFRDILRADDAARALYGETKQQLAQRAWPTIQDYADAKTDVIAAILTRSTDDDAC